ncbi:MAG: PIN domain-containing protein [Desulfurococcales archaeon]|nr:PIN domain-containing protein [Desulfurococcales archaeon]
MNKVFIDTNIFYNILFETSLTRKARKLLEDYEENKFYTSLTVINELLYISTRKYYQATEELKGPYSLRKLIVNKGYPKFIVDGIENLLEDLEVKVLVENVEYQDMIETASQLKLLPSDAIIALTCKRNDIDTIIAFDEDFKRIPWLKVAP